MKKYIWYLESIFLIIISIILLFITMEITGGLGRIEKHDSDSFWWLLYICVAIFISVALLQWVLMFKFKSKQKLNIENISVFIWSFLMTLWMFFMSKEHYWLSGYFKEIALLFLLVIVPYICWYIWFNINLKKRIYSEPFFSIKLLHAYIHMSLLSMLFIGLTVLWIKIFGSVL